MVTKIVNRMISRYITSILLTGLFLLTTCLHAASSFTATFSAKEVELGKAITLVLSTSGTKPALNSIKLNILETYFHVNTSADVEFNEQTGRQTWKLRLTPYNTGKIKLPSLLFNNEHNQAITLTVTEAIDKKTGTPIRLLAHVSSKQPWMREQVLFSVHLKTNMPRAQLKLTSATVENAIVEQLDIHHGYIDTDPHLPHHYKTGWAVFPLASGKIKVTLPAVELIRDGVTTHHFYPAPLELDVQALPLYIPATIPVGKIELSNEHSIRYVLQNSLDDYKLSLTGQNILLRNLPEITNQINSNQAIRVYPETTKTIQTNTYNGITSRINYVIPVKALAQGHSRLDDIRLTYFDPVSGTLKTHYQPNLILLSINTWLAWLFTIVALILSGYALLKLIQWLLRFREKIISYSTAIVSLQLPCTPEELKTAISLMSRAEGYSANVTLQSWFDTIKYAEPDGAFKEELSRLLYVERPATVPLKLREKMLKIAFANVPIVRWFSFVGAVSGRDNLA